MNLNITFLYQIELVYSLLNLDQPDYNPNHLEYFYLSIIFETCLLDLCEPDIFECTLELIFAITNWQQMVKPEKGNNLYTKPW